MLKRRIEQTLIEWKEDANHNPLILKGCRQCGKTFRLICKLVTFYFSVQDRVQ